MKVRTFLLRLVSILNTLFPMSTALFILTHIPLRAATIPQTSQICATTSTRGTSRVKGSFDTFMEAIMPILQSEQLQTAVAP